MLTYSLKQIYNANQRAHTAQHYGHFEDSEKYYDLKNTLIKEAMKIHKYVINGDLISFYNDGYKVSSFHFKFNI